MSVMPLVVSDAKNVTTRHSLDFCLVGPFDHTADRYLGFVWGTGRKWREKLPPMVIQVPLATGNGLLPRAHGKNQGPTTEQNKQGNNDGS